jgi:hypothetical protein
MAPEVQRIAIAKACGLTIVSDSITHHLTPYGKKTERDPEGCFLKECPNYLNDLNAMHEAERMLTDINLYRKFLYLIVLEDPSNASNEPAWATAAQRAEAFLRTLNLWN